MSQRIFDERDIMFNVRECPGFQKVSEVDKYEEFSTEDLDLIFEQMLQFSQDELAPKNSEFDQEGSHLVGDCVKTPASMKELWENYLEIGLTAVIANPEYGGIGMPHLFAAALSELEIGACLSFSMISLLTRESANLIDSFGSEALKDVYLEKMYSGEWTGTMCLTEPQAGSDVGAARTKAVPAGDAYRITGTKSFISWGDHDLSDNIIHLVLARVEGAPKGSKGLSLFVVPKFKLDKDGNPAESNDVICSSVEHKMGIKASSTCVLNFGENGNCTGYIVGEENQGLKYMFQMMNAARNGVGLQGMALASVACEYALQYAKERKQGALPGQTESTEIINHPDIRYMLMKMKAIVQASRALVFHGAYYEDLLHHPEEAEKAAILFELLTPICKSYCTDMGFKVTELAMQVYGGYGFCKDYPIEQLMRDIKITSIYEGTNGIQGLDLVFRKLLGTKGASWKTLALEMTELTNRVKQTKLAALAEQLEKAVNSCSRVMGKFGELAMNKQFHILQFHATQLLNAMGHLCGGYFLLKAAEKALPQKEAEAFYADKINTCEFYFSYLLPEAETTFRILQQASGELVKADL
ncbi:MAG: acyl-CoA dehydrogenase [Acidobacteria bacterium]|nr:MAG: acyl-CoA dehydrogenase [Acidobacteriota bacterium]